MNDERYVTVTVRQCGVPEIHCTIQLSFQASWRDPRFREHDGEDTTDIVYELLDQDTSLLWQHPSS